MSNHDLILKWLDGELVDNDYLTENQDLRDQLINLYYALKDGKIIIPKTERVDDEI